MHSCERVLIRGTTKRKTHIIKSNDLYKMISYDFSSCYKSLQKLKLKKLFEQRKNNANVKVRGVNVMLWLRRPAVQNKHCQFKLVSVEKKQMSTFFYNLQKTSDEHCQQSQLSN